MPMHQHQYDGYSTEEVVANEEEADAQATKQAGTNEALDSSSIECKPSPNPTAFVQEASIAFPRTWTSFESMSPTNTLDLFPALATFSMPPTNTGDLFSALPTFQSMGSPASTTTDVLPPLATFQRSFLRTTFPSVPKSTTTTTSVNANDTLSLNSMSIPSIPEPTDQKLAQTIEVLPSALAASQHMPTTLSTNTNVTQGSISTDSKLPLESDNKSAELTSHRKEFERHTKPSFVPKKQSRTRTKTAFVKSFCSCDETMHDLRRGLTNSLMLQGNLTLDNWIPRITEHPKSLSSHEIHKILTSLRILDQLYSKALPKAPPLAIGPASSSSTSQVHSPEPMTSMPLSPEEPSTTISQSRSSMFIYMAAQIVLMGLVWQLGNVLNSFRNSTFF